MKDVVIELIHPGLKPDDDIRTEVFAKLTSAGRNEQTAAGQSGYKNALKFKIASCEYDEQPEIQYDSKRLTIYRTYEPNLDEIELYAAERIGNSVRN